MVIPRQQLVPTARVPSAYHLISRCVRRSYLLRDDEDDQRRQLLEDLLYSLIKVLAVDLCAYAIMENHFHNVIIVRLDLADGWSDLEVAQR